MTAPTWAAVHAGDTVRGADGRDYRVIEAEPLGTWLGSGVTEIKFTLEPGPRVVTRATTDIAPLVARADHSTMAGAFSALLDAGFVPDPLKESLMSDAFTSPAAPPAEVKRDQWGRYVLPHPVTGKEQAWTRVTTIARTLVDEFGLTQWKLRMTAKGLALRPDLIAGAAAADPDTDKGTLNGIVDKAMERAGSSTGANLGTALHSFTQRLDMGEALSALGAPPPLDRDLAAYLEALKRHGLGVRPELVERVVINVDHGYGGTLDRAVTQPPGHSKAAPFAVFDLKTGKDLSYSGLEIATQEAMYARATHMWDPVTRTWLALADAPLDRDRGLVMHLPVGKAHGELYGVNLVKGWEFAQLAMSVRAARSAGKSLMWLVDPDPAALLLHRVSIADQAELARLWEANQTSGLWTDEVNAAAHARMAQLSGQLATA